MFNRIIAYTDTSHSEFNIENDRQKLINKLFELIKSNDTVLIKHKDFKAVKTPQPFIEEWEKKGFQTSYDKRYEQLSVFKPIRLSLENRLGFFTSCKNNLVLGSQNKARIHDFQIEPRDTRFLLQARHEQHVLIRKYHYAVKAYLKTHLNLMLIHTSTKLFPDGYSKKIAPFPHCDLSADDVKKGIHFFIICIGDSQLGTHVYTDKKWASMVP